MSQQLFYQCQVLNIDDPLMLGRVRGRRLIDNYDDILKSISDPPWNEQTDIWTERDPFVFQPLLPYYVYQTPKVDEMVLVMYLTSDVPFINQYYVQSTFYSPTSTNFQYYQGGNKFTGTGIQIKNPKPLKNLDGTYTDKEKHKGVFPEPGDNALLGRGSADVIVKENDVLIRAGKFKGNNLYPNVIPGANDLRGFFQLSKFNRETSNLKSKKYTYVNEVVFPVKYLVEYHITNPENANNKFNGYIFLYQLKANNVTASNNLTVSSAVPQNLKTLVVMKDFTNLTITEVSNFINNFLKTCNDKNVDDEGNILFPNNQKFPIFYRPLTTDYELMSSQPIPIPAINTDYECQGSLVENADGCSITITVQNLTTSQVVISEQAIGNCSEIPQLYTIVLTNVMEQVEELGLGYVLIPTLQDIQDGVPPQIPPINGFSDGLAQANLAKIYQNVKLYSGIEGGYGLIYKQGQVGTPIDIQTKVEPQSQVNPISTTIGALGADKLYFLSHLTAIPGKKKINFDRTLYGITEEQFANEILPNTSSFVRGEELIEILNLIVEFLITHVHPFPGRAPLPTTRSNMQLSTLKNAMQNATNTMLNKNIRLN